MNGEVEFVGNKKKNLIDDEPVSKKAARNQQKYLNKTLTSAKIMSQFQQKKANEKKQSEKSNFSNGNSKQGGKLDPKIKKKVDDIKAILSQLSQKTILQTLKKHNYNQQQTLQQLFNLEPQEQLQPKPPSNSTSSKTKQQLGNQLLDQIYANNEEIDPSQFEQLFAQIADIIKHEQKIQGMDVFQINKFIDDCYLVKNFILEDQTQIYIDQNDELVRSIQIFMQQIIKNQVALQIKRQQQFPTLGSVTKNTKQKGIIQKIQEQYKEQRSKQEYFMPSRVPQIYSYNTKEETNKYSIYSVNNNPRSYEDILQLSKEYNNMGINKLKYVYLQLEDINLCKKFLDRFYLEFKTVKQEQRKNPSTSNPSPTKPSPKPSYKRLQDINYKNYSLKQIREQLDHLFKLRSLFTMTKGKTTNIAHRKQLTRLAHRDDSRIEKLCEVARYKAIEDMMENNLQYVDLHGYREEEIQELFNQIADMIKTQFRKGNSKLQTNKVGSNVYCVVRALTGKGLHSKYNRSVLKPCLLSWCDNRNYKATETEDSINVFIEVR